MFQKIKDMWALRKNRNAPVITAKLNDYIKTEYPDYKVTDEKTVILKDFVPLRQADYNDKLNCSITSMAACINYYTGGKHKVEDIYRYIKIVAKFFLYVPNLWGTFSFMIMPIFAVAKYHYKVKIRGGCRYFKGLGYGTGRIISHINSGRPVLLNMFRDGRKCYHNHTVTIIGYKIYYSGKDRKVFLILNDNWAKEERVLDYSKLSIISSINY